MYFIQFMYSIRVELLFRVCMTIVLLMALTRPLRADDSSSKLLLGLSFGPDQFTITENGNSQPSATLAEDVFNRSYRIAWMTPVWQLGGGLGVGLHLKHQHHLLAQNFENKSDSGFNYDNEIQHIAMKSDINYEQLELSYTLNRKGSWQFQIYGAKGRRQSHFWGDAYMTASPEASATCKEGFADRNQDIVKSDCEYFTFNVRGSSDYSEHGIRLMVLGEERNFHLEIVDGQKEIIEAGGKTYEHKNPPRLHFQFFGWLF